MTQDTILFAFPSISLSLSDAPQSNYGLLVLSPASTPSQAGNDLYLRLQFTPDSPHSPPLDILIEAYQTLSKTSHTTFNLNSSFGLLTLEFPALTQSLPEHDDRIDIPVEVRRGMSWGDVVASFETEVDRWVVYSKNEFSLIGSGAAAADYGRSQGAGIDWNDEKKKASYGYGDEKKGVVSGSGANVSYDPSQYDQKQAKPQGKLVLVDEENGIEVGEVAGGELLSQGVVPGSKDPVEITLPEDGKGPVTVRPADFLTLDPAYQKSTLVSTAATASHLLITTSTYISSAMSSGASSFAKSTKPVAPLTFQPSTHARITQFHNLSSSAARISATTIGKVGHYAQQAGAKLAGKDKPRGAGKPANPGILNKSLVAFSTVAEGVEYAGKQLLGAGSEAASRMVHHRYGDEAGSVARGVTGSVTNAALVYIDAAGVSRKAVMKGVAKGMVIGSVKTKDGKVEDVVVPGTGPEGGMAVDEKGNYSGGLAGGNGVGYESRPVGSPPPPGYTPVGSGRNSPMPQSVGEKGGYRY